MLYNLNQNQHKLSYLEIAEKELTNGYWGKNIYPSYPRHMTTVSVKSHREGQLMTVSHRFLPKTCRLTKSDSTTFEPETNVALRVLQYQLNDRQAKQTHLENVKSSLERRLQAAKLSGNDYLIDLLQKESQQLEINT